MQQSKFLVLKITFLSVFVMLSACGKKGGLYLPSDPEPYIKPITKTVTAKEKQTKSTADSKKSNDKPAEQ